MGMVRWQNYAYFSYLNWTRVFKLLAAPMVVPC